jgi:hypothetical protein
MKIPLLATAGLLVAAAVILAGCTGTPSSPGTVTLPRSTPVVTTTPVAYTNLSQLVLSREELPFTAMNEKEQIPNISAPAFSQLGAIRGYTKYTMSENEVSPTSVQLGQTIVEYPPGNATLAFADFIRQTQKTASSRFNISLFEVPGIGDRSRALVILDNENPTQNVIMIVFTKSNIMESVVMIGADPDPDALTLAARIAAAKIP